VPYLVTTIVWILGLLVGTVLLTSIAVVLGIDIPLISQNLTIASQQRLQLLPPIAISSGVLIAVLAYVRERSKQREEVQRNVSSTLLDQTEKGFEEVLRLLRGKPNDRLIWVRAARALLKAESLGVDITSPEYRKAFLLLTERVRNDLYLELTEPDAKTGARTSLPPQFFYGIDAWKSGISLDDAAIKASQDVNVYSITIDAIPPESGLLPLSEKAVIAIFDFIEYPPDYEDPLRSVKEWDSNWQDSHGASAGARRYIAHRKNKYAFAGKLHERKNSG
jgi:hypothetical protein